MHPKFAINTFQVFADGADVNAQVSGDLTLGESSLKRRQLRWRTSVDLPQYLPLGLGMINYVNSIPMLAVK
jgi:hypothetical protein